MKANAHSISRPEATMNTPLLRTAALTCLALACSAARQDSHRVRVASPGCPQSPQRPAWTQRLAWHA